MAANDPVNQLTKAAVAGERNRLATLLWYMAAPEEGGETHFPRAGAAHHTNTNDGLVGRHAFMPFSR